MVNILIVLKEIGVPVAIVLGSAWVTTARGFLWDGCLLLVIGFICYGILELIFWIMHMHERENFYE